MLKAEEFGITQANVDEMKKSENPEIKRFLGVEAETKIGTDLGLDNDWAVQHRQGRRQLRRDLRAQRRRRLAAEDRARPERAVDQGRPAVRAADPLIATDFEGGAHTGPPRLVPE